MRKANEGCGLSRRAVLAGAAGLAALGLPGQAMAVPVADLGGRVVHSVSDGGFLLPSSMLARGVPAEELAAFLKANNLPSDASRSVLNVTLVQDGETWTAIDCGSGANFLAGSGKLAANLEAAGIDREKITKVLFTHAHPDHLWGAIDEFDSDLFPNAAYVMGGAERDFWMAPDIYSKLPEDRHAFAAGAQRILKAIQAKTTFIKAGAEPVPGILALDSPGHTPGHLAFEVRGKAGSVLVVGDAITHPMISFRHPEWMSGADFDGAQASRTRKALLDRLASEKLPLLGYHLPVPGLGRVERDGTAYRFVIG